MNLVAGLNTITVVATDAATNSATATRTVTSNTVEPGLPPDPSTVAPALDRTIATNPATSAQFLYNGATPIQTGVQANAIDVSRQAVIRGRVLNAALQPLQGVTVSVRGEPQLGSTKSRVDGWYDLALNGGGVVAIDFVKTGYLPAQRNVEAPWQEFVIVDDVVLMQPDAAATAITLGNANTQIVRASAVSDDDGARRTTLLVEPNMQATIVRADGTTQPATVLTLRVTEFTVGDSVRAAMPAELPPTSGFTFAIQVTADEAIAMGAREVTFATPVPVYLENFLNFPVGMSVPVGALDVVIRAWVPQANGRIIKILSVAGGTAAIDADGDGAADSDAALNALAIDLTERQQLATLYAANQTLWRAVITSTRPYDFNYPAGVRGVDPTGRVDGGCTTRRSDLIGCEIQVVRQDAPIQGAPFSLAYNSSLATGAATSRTLDVVLTGASIPPDLRGVELEVEVGGRTFKQTFAPAANLATTFAWDGKDAYGRAMQGAQPVTMRIGHVYPVEYRVPAPVAQSFGIPCTATTCVITAPTSYARGSQARVQTIRTSLGAFEPKALGIGGLTPSIHHAYDPVGRVLYKGGGTRRSAAIMPPIARNVAGNGGAGGNGGDGTPAATAQLNTPWGLRVAADGSLYILSSGSPASALRRVRPDGIIERVAGSDAVPPNCTIFFGNPGCGDGGPAVNAGINAAFSMVALGPDGSVYIADGGNHRVRRVTSNGIIQNFAGTPGSSAGDNQSAQPLGDGGPATQAVFIQPWSVAVAPDGAVYIGDNRRRVRRVGSDGIITAFAGTGVAGFSGDGGPASLAQMDDVKGIALSPDGSLYIVEANHIRRVTPDGIISTVLGAPTTGSFTAQGVQASTLRGFQLRAIAVAPDGVIYFTDHTILRRIGTDGIVTTVAGRSVFSPPPEPRAALDVALGQMESVTVGPDGAVYVGVSSPARVYRITPAQGGFSLGELAIADDQADEIAVFSPTGRHLRTIDATTRVTLFSFTYDAQNRLTGIVDQFNQTTQIVRDVNGVPLRLVASTGQIVNIVLDANGYMASLTGPDGRPVQFVFGPSGLLTQIVNENGKATNYGYDAQGRLTNSTDANNALQTATAVGTSANRTVTFQSTGERATLQSVQTPLGGMQVTVRDAQNRAATATENPDGSVTATHPDGTTVTSLQRAHPLHEMQAPLMDFTMKTPAGLTFNQRSGAAVVKDAADNLESETDSSFTNGRAKLTTYDYATRMTMQTSAAGRRRTAIINPGGLVQRDSVAGVLARSYSYDATGRLTSRSQGNRTWGFGYDAMGRMTTITNAKGEVRRLGYNAADRPTVFVTALGDTARMGYDSIGLVTTVTPATRPAHHFAYSPTGLVTTYTPPNVGDGAPPLRMQYDADGRLTHVLRQSGDSLVFAYDSTGRITSMRSAETTTSYAYSATTGHLTSLTAPTRGILSFLYDGALVTRHTWSGAVAGNVGFTYDNDFRLSAETVNNANSINFSYDSDSRLTSAGVLAITRDPNNGRITGTTLGSVSSSVTYDAYSMANRLTTSYAGNSLFDLQHLHDSLSRIVAATEVIGGVTVTFGYTYDAAGRLQAVSRNGEPEASYSYDGNGNRMAVTTTVGTMSATTDAQDRPLTQGTTSFSYTRDGELRESVTGVDTTRYAYGAERELLSVRLPNGTLIEYVYDPQGRQIGKTVNGTLVRGWLYGTGLGPVAELDASNNVAIRFVYADRENVPEYMIKAGVTYRLVHDHLGSVRLVVNASTGAIAQRMDYDAFGQALTNTAPDFQPFGFAGGLYDQQTALVRFDARHYFPSLGRWTAKDPLRFEGGSQNLYSYVGSDPVNSRDPAGLWQLTESQMTVLLYGTVAALAATAAQQASAAIGNSSFALAFDFPKRWGDRPIGPIIPPVSTPATPPDPDDEEFLPWWLTRCYAASILGQRGRQAFVDMLRKEGLVRIGGAFYNNIYNWNATAWQGACEEFFVPR